MLKIDVVETGRETWLGHECTKAQRRKAAESAKKLLSLLLNICGDSTDPNVLRAYGKWRVQAHMAETLGASSEELGGENGTK